MRTRQRGYIFEKACCMKVCQREKGFRHVSKVTLKVCFANENFARKVPSYEILCSHDGLLSVLFHQIAADISHLVLIRISSI